MGLRDFCAAAYRALARRGRDYDQREAKLSLRIRRLNIKPVAIGSANEGLATIRIRQATLSNASPALLRKVSARTGVIPI